MEKHQTEFKEAIENTPIIPAIKDAESLEQCLKSDACVIFILFGDICNIAEIVERIKAEGKLAMVHMDLIAGLGSKEVSVDYIKERTKADGIITTKPMLAKHARELGAVRNLPHILQVLFHGIDETLHLVLCILDIILTNQHFIPVVQQQAYCYRYNYRHQGQGCHNNRLYIRHLSFLYLHIYFPKCSVRYFEGDIPYLRLNT